METQRSLTILCVSSLKAWKEKKGEKPAFLNAFFKRLHKWPFILVNINTEANNRSRSGCADGRIVRQAGKWAAALVPSHDTSNRLWHAGVFEEQMHRTVHVTQSDHGRCVSRTIQMKTFFLKSRKGQVVNRSQLTQSEAWLCADMHVHMRKLSGVKQRRVSCTREAGNKTRLMFPDR